MILTEQYRQLARYNTWMNEKLYAEAAALDDAARKRDLGAFFRSLHGTLNHLLWADRIWLWRFTQDPDDRALAGPRRQPDPESACTIRSSTPTSTTCGASASGPTATSTAWVDGLDDERCAAPIRYQSLTGGAREHPLWMAVTHFFNHQTHHRGQATTLLTQLGRDPGVTDFMVFLWSRMDEAAKA